MGMPPKNERQTLMFSATFPEEIQKLARDMLNDYIFVTVGRIGGANIDIEQRVLQVSAVDKRDQLINILTEQGLSYHSNYRVGRKLDYFYCAAAMQLRSCDVHVSICLSVRPLVCQMREL